MRVIFDLIIEALTYITYLIIIDTYSTISHDLLILAKLVKLHSSFILSIICPQFSSKVWDGGGGGGLIRLVSKNWCMVNVVEYIIFVYLLYIL